MFNDDTIMYAVIDLQGHQYIVQKGDQIVVDKIKNDAKKLTIDTVLATFDAEGEQVSVGNPYLKEVNVIADIVENKKGDKIKVLKYHIKNRYQRIIGFRPHQTVLKIKEIQTVGVSKKNSQ